MVIEPLQSDYGDLISINYFDINEDDIHPNIENLIETHFLLLPLTFVNGEVICAGFVSYYDVVGKLDQILGRLAS